MLANSAPAIIAAAVAQQEFADTLDCLGPFEPAPHFAVAVSGGADSLSLCLLTHEYAKHAGGRITAITVDHGLRDGSADEATQVARWLKKHGIAHVTLRWDAAHKPNSNVQALAREARYRLMAQWCHNHHALWLLTAHHQDDQAETFLLRLSRGSGLEGLSSMSPVNRLAGITLLRPLLSFPKARLEATLIKARQPWLEDPSNLSDAYLRNHLRTWLGKCPSDLLPTHRIADAAAALGRARAALDVQVAETLARHVEIFPQGYLSFHPTMLVDLPQEVALRALERMLTTIGGHTMPPRFEKLTRVYRFLVSGEFSRPFTFAGCYGLPASRRAPHALLMREPAACEGALPLRAGETLRWDKRWQITLVDAPRPTRKLTVCALGPNRLKTALSALPRHHRLHRLPKTLPGTFPCLMSLDELVAAPHMDYLDPKFRKLALEVRFAPPKPLAGSAFFVME